MVSMSLKVRGPLFCGAKLANRDGTCRQGAGYDTTHTGWGRCKLHGGATKSHIEAAAIAHAQATARLFGVPRQIHPLDGLLEDYYRSTGLVDAYEAMCMQLLPEEVVWGIIGEERSTVSEEEGGEPLTPAEIKTRFGAAVHIWVKVLNEERDRRNKLGEAILRLDIDSRRAEFQASQVAQLVAVLLSPELHLNEDQRRAAARILRSLETDQPAAIEGTLA